MGIGLFSVYATRENRITAAVLSVFRGLTLGAIDRILAALLKQSEFELVEIEDQPARDGRGVPDGAIVASCRILLETKVSRNAVNRTQIERHLARLNDKKEATTCLLVLTPDDTPSPVIESIDDPRVVWASFVELNQAIDAYLSDSQEVVAEREAFLLRELQGLLVAEGLIGTGYDTLIVAARRAWPLYAECGVAAYVCQPNRSFQTVQRLAFYCANRIESKIPRIIKRHVDVILEGNAHVDRLREVIEEYLKARPERRGKRAQVMVLSGPDDHDTVRLPSPIENDLLAESGRRIAYTQGHTYARLDDLKQVRSTSELVKRMRHD